MNSRKHLRILVLAALWVVVAVLGIFFSGCSEPKETVVPVDRIYLADGERTSGDCPEIQSLEWEDQELFLTVSYCDPGEGCIAELTFGSMSEEVFIEEDGSFTAYSSDVAGEYEVEGNIRNDGTITINVVVSHNGCLNTYLIEGKFERYPDINLY